MPSTNLFIFGLTKPTLLWLNSLDFRSSSSSSLEKNVSLGISSNSLPSLLGLEPIRCKRDWTAKEAAEARGALDRAAPGHQVSRLWKKWMRKTNYKETVILSYKSFLFHCHGFNHWNAKRKTNERRKEQNRWLCYTFFPERVTSTEVSQPYSSISHFLRFFYRLLIFCSLFFIALCFWAIPPDLF